MNQTFNRILLAFAALGIAAPAPMAAPNFQGTRSALRTSAPQIPASPGVPISTFFEAPFLELNHLAELTMAKRELDVATLPNLLANLRTRTGGIPQSMQIAKVILYSGLDPALPPTSPADFVHGVSLLRQFGLGQEYHELYRFDVNTGTYEEVSAASMWLDGALTVQDLLLLNFGCVPAEESGDLAQRSGIQILFPPVSAPFIDAWPGAAPGVELPFALIADQGLRRGMGLIGAHGEAMYTQLAGGPYPLPFECSALPYCGHLPLPNKCAIIGFGFGCILDFKRIGCPLLSLNATILDALMLPESGISPWPLDQCWEFRDTYLNKSETGRRYISWYYQLGTLLEVDLFEVPTYLDLLGKASVAMDILMDDNSAEVVITQPLADAILAVLAIQRNKLSHPGMLAILDQVEADMMLLTGLTRPEFELLFSDI